MCDNISVSCSHVDHNRDKNCVEYNRVLHVILGGSGQFNIGKVTVHLHHTKRSIQMQGSAIMPDGNRTPIWFLTHFLQEKLITLAKEKQFDITVMNNAVREAVGNSVTENVSNICQHCARHFDTKSKPTQCRHCSCYFHKTSCLPDHGTSCSKKQNFVPAKSSSSTLNPVPPASSSLPPSHKRKRTDTDYPQPTPPPSTISPTSPTRSDTIQSRLPSHSQQRLVAGPFQSLTHLGLPPTRHPSPSPTPPCDPPTHSSASALPTSNTNDSVSPLNALAVPFNPVFANNRRKTMKNKNLNPEQAKIDFLNLELDASKTRIVQLETTVEDRDVTIKILNEKIKLLEQNQQNYVNSNYRNQDPYLSGHSSCPHTHSHNLSSSPSCCHHSLRPQCHHYQSPPKQHLTPEPANCVSSGHVAILTEIKTTLENIKEEIRGLSRISDKYVAANCNIMNTDDTNTVPSVANNPDHIETVSVDIIEAGSVSDDSIASIDYFVPGPDLNSRNPTSQHLLLMQ